MATHTENTSMMVVRSAERGDIPSVDDVALRIRLGSTDTAAAFVLLDVTLPPYWDACVLHWHANTTEMIYVLTGTLACTWGDTTTTAGQGTAILLPPGTAHTIWNPTPTPAIYLAWFTPGGAAWASTYVLDPGPASRTMLATLSATDDVLLSRLQVATASTRTDSC